MSVIFGQTSGQPIMWFHKNPARSNQRCLYCNAFVGRGAKVGSNKEHLIGRRFVPKGSLAQSGHFNFIFRACKVCNRRKAVFEDHLSSVTLATSPARYADPEIDDLARRKAAESYHPERAGVPVKDAGEDYFIDLGGPSLGIRLGYKSPPQPSARCVRLLACGHVQALFSLVATKNPRELDQLRLLHPERVWFLNAYPHGDWGNAQLRELERRASAWPCFAIVNAAGGFFRALLRQQQVGSETWFWALEWNKSLRVVGALAALGDRPEVLKCLPELDWERVPGTVGDRMRTETPLASEADTLFKASVGSDGG